MGPLPRSLAVEANGCFMVRVRRGSNRIQGCGARPRAHGGLPSVRAHRVWREGGIERDTDVPDLAEPGAVLAPVNTASRRLRRWPAASVDRRCAQRLLLLRPGWRNGPQPNKETSSMGPRDRDRASRRPPAKISLDRKRPIQVPASQALGTVAVA